MSSVAVVAILFLGMTQAAAPQSSLSQKRDVLGAVVAITTLPLAEVMKSAPTAPIEHDTEVSRTETVTVVVNIQKCEPGSSGACQATADIVTRRPDGSVHSETKGLSLANGRGTTTLALKPDDVTGVYTVEATVRDPNARRFAKAERIFGVK